MSLDFATRTPAKSHEPELRLASTTDTQASVERVVSGGDAVTFEVPGATEVTEEGGRIIVTDAVEDENSSRNQLLARLEKAEREAKAELEELEGLTPEAERDRVEALKAMQEGAEDGTPEEGQEQPEQPETPALTNPVYEAALKEEAEAGRDAAAFADTFHRPLFTSDDEGVGRYQDLMAIVNTLPNREAVVIGLARDPQLLQKITTAQSGAEVQRELKKFSAKLQFPAPEQPAASAKPHSRLGPTPAVGGTVRSSVPPDEMSYQEFRQWREKTRRRY